MAILLIFLFRNPKVMWLSLRNACVLSLQLCLTLCDPTDCRGGSCVHGILQARIPEWVAISSSRGYFRPRDWNFISSVSFIGRWVLYHSCHLGSSQLPEMSAPSYSPRHKSCTKTSSSQAYFAMTITSIFTPFNSPCTVLQISHLKTMSKYHKRLLKTVT